LGLLRRPGSPKGALFPLRPVVRPLGMGGVASAAPPAMPGDEDKLLIKADKNPNTRGAEVIGLGGDARALLADAREGRVRCLWVFHHELLASAWPAADTRAALARLDTLIWSGTNAGATREPAHPVPPSAAWVEREGTFTNFEGRVQRLRTAIEPLGGARPDWAIVGDVLRARAADPSAPTRAEQWFRRLVEAVPEFAGM